MSTALSNSLVVIAIVVSLSYAVWRLGPRKMRDAVRVRLRTALPSVFGHLSDSSSGSGCDACGGCPTTTTKNEPAPRKEHGVFWRNSTR
jgi:hypothetical protein